MCVYCFTFVESYLWGKFLEVGLLGRSEGCAVVSGIAKSLSMALSHLDLLPATWDRAGFPTASLSKYVIRLLDFSEYDS